MQTPSASTIKHHSLSDLARSITAQIEKIYHKSYWIVAEVLKLNHYPQSGHCYPLLVEKKDGKIIAEMRGMIYKGNYKLINSEFLKITGKPLQDGMQILFKCKVSFHATYGLSLVITDVQPSYTLGEMARLRQVAIRKLKEEKIFDLNKSRYLPMLVQHIAIISVETSKGFLDFKNILSRSPFPNVIGFRLFPALLQGDAAVESIIAALDKIQNSGQKFDAVLIIRGGGGETGLDCYDNYKLARHVCLFPIPILTGIGHATNLTVVEQVAHKNLITPTDLAGFLIQNYVNFNERLEKVKQRLINFKRIWFKISIDRIDNMSLRLTTAAQEKIQENRYRIRVLGNRFTNSVKERLQQAVIDMDYRKPNQLQMAAQEMAQRAKQQLENRSIKIPAYISAQLKDEKLKLDFIADKLRILDPKNTLKRGYSITTFKGKPITDTKEIASGSEIETRLWKGKIISIVK